MVDAEPLIGRVLDDEGLTGDLDGAEAEALVKWLVAKVERVAATARSADAARTQVAALAKTARAISAVVAKPDAATAQAAGLPWPPPKTDGPAGLLVWLFHQLDARLKT